MATVDGQEVHVRHGIGRRDAYGRPRVRSVTWVQGDPLVEGVESDDFDRSEALLSLIKVTEQHLKPDATAPPGYLSLPVVVMADEIRASGAPRSPAVKLRQDDVAGWTRHALLRAVGWDRLRSQPTEREVLPPASGVGPAPADVHILDDDELRAAVVAALLAYAEQHKSAQVEPTAEFTQDQEANEFLLGNDFACLTGVLFDQGVSAERAWRAPFLLYQRLGHFDPERIAQDEAGVREAIAKPPKLHRYIEKTPRWLVLAARRVMTEYAGDAGAIWSDHPVRTSCRSASRRSSASARRRPRWRWRSWNATAACPSGTWNEATSPTTSTCAASSSAPASPTSTTATT